MAHHSTRTKSPNHEIQNEDVQQPRALDNIQRQLEEELENAQRVLVAAEGSTRGHSRAASGWGSFRLRYSHGRDDRPRRETGPSRPHPDVEGRQASPRASPRAPSPHDSVEPSALDHVSPRAGSPGRAGPRASGSPSFAPEGMPERAATSHRSSRGASLGGRTSRGAADEDLVESAAEERSRGPSIPEREPGPRAASPAENFEGSRVSPRSGHGISSEIRGSWGARPSSRGGSPPRGSKGSGQENPVGSGGSWGARASSTAGHYNEMPAAGVEEGVIPSRGGSWPRESNLSWQENRARSRGSSGARASSTAGYESEMPAAGFEEGALPSRGGASPRGSGGSWGARPSTRAGYDHEMPVVGVEEGVIPSRGGSWPRESKPSWQENRAGIGGSWGARPSTRAGYNDDVPPAGFEGLISSSGGSWPREIKGYGQENPMGSGGSWGARPSSRVGHDDDMTAGGLEGVISSSGGSWPRESNLSWPENRARSRGSSGARASSTADYIKDKLAASFEEGALSSRGGASPRGSGGSWGARPSTRAGYDNEMSAAGFESSLPSRAGSWPRESKVACPENPAGSRGSWGSRERSRAGYLDDRLAAGFEEGVIPSRAGSSPRESRLSGQENLAGRRGAPAVGCAPGAASRPFSDSGEEARGQPTVAFVADNCRGGRSSPPRITITGPGEGEISRRRDGSAGRPSSPTSRQVTRGPQLTPSPYSAASARDYPSRGSHHPGSPRDTYPQGARYNGPRHAFHDVHSSTYPPYPYGNDSTLSDFSSGPHHHTTGGGGIALQELSNLSGIRKGASQRRDSGRCAKVNAPGERKLPKKPDLTPDEIQELIQRESRDVESAWRLTSDQKATYKKPCPKQQKAQMDVKHIVRTHGGHPSKQQPCGKDYPPLIDPDPEDISPEVAAAMMFSQEQGIKLESCPGETIKYLFPDERRGAPESNVSIVDPNQKDQAEMMEKSAMVPSEGVSDSAYTRTMKMKGEEVGSRKSYDIDMALGQGKSPERTWLSVVVAQKPQRFNKVQFRGNQPSWFPGYFSAFPDQPDGIKLVSSPSGLFQKAWMTTNPKNIPASDVVVVE